MLQRDRRIAALEACPTRTPAEQRELHLLTQNRDQLWRRIGRQYRHAKRRADELAAYARQHRLSLWTLPRFAGRVEAHDYLLDAARHLLAERERALPGADRGGQARGRPRRSASWSWRAASSRSGLGSPTAGPRTPPRVARARPLQRLRCRARPADVTAAADAAWQQAERAPTDLRREIADLYAALAWWQRVLRCGAAYVVVNAEERRAINAAARAQAAERVAA